jgi:NADH-quinone oxidoreductase subunit N
MERIADVAARAPSTLLWFGMGLVLIGLVFKIAAVPFHFWVPDVYQGAPTNVTAFMAAATKTVAFAALLRFLPGAFGERTAAWVPLLTWMSILTMTTANLVALAQTNVKRLLAFSSISHAGYLLIAVVSRPDLGVSAVVFYLLAYAFMTVGAFVVAAAVGRGDAKSESGYDLASWQGLGWRRPGLGVAMTIFLFSLAGIPPTAGFLGKYVIFLAAVDSKLYLLAAVGAVNAVIGAYYYLRIIVAIWMREPETEELPLPVSPATAFVLIVAVAGVFYLGLAPGRVLAVTRTLYALL